MKNIFRGTACAIFAAGFAPVIGILAAIVLFLGLFLIAGNAPASNSAAFYSGAVGPNWGSILANGNATAMTNRALSYFRGIGVDISKISKTLGDYKAWHALSVGGGTTLKFFQGTLTSSATNQRGFTRPENEHFLIFGIEFAQSTDTATAFPNGSVFDQGIDNDVLLNGKLDIVQNGVKQLTGWPMLDFQRVAEEKNSGRLDLAMPILWRGQTDIEVNVTLGTAIAPVNNQYLMCKLHGIALFS